MATDWAADVKKFVPNADDEVIKGIVRYCGIALQKPDSSLVSYTDPVELGRVRNNFLKKKLGLTDSDEVLDKAIAAVGERMKGVNFKNRVTVYYLLLDHLGLHHMFKKGAVAAGGAAAAGLAAVAAVPLAAASTPAAAPIFAKPAPGAATPQALASTQLPPPNHFEIDRGGKGGLGWLLWLLAALALLWALWVFFTRDTIAPIAPAADTTVAAPMTDPGDANTTAAVAEPVVAAPVVIPAGAGVTSELRDGKPLVKVYFDTGKSQVVDAFAPAAATLKTYLDAHPGSGLGVSGYNDPTGNAVANAALSKSRAQAVQGSLVAAGIAATSIELIKPAAATDAQVTKEEARRVEVYIK
jgi:outer membrane protein OmpA-like peptidoglycan-associated protein